MERDLHYIHVFKTNITQVDPVCAMKNALDNHKDILQWSIDCEDVDCVLRVVSETLLPETIINLIHQFGYQCQELN